MTVIASLLFRVLARFPLAWLHLLGGWTGHVACRFSPSYRRRLQENLERAVGRSDPALLDEAIAGAGRQALELPFVWMRSQDEVLARIGESGAARKAAVT